MRHRVLLAVALSLGALLAPSLAEEPAPTTRAELEQALSESYSKLEAEYRTLPRDLFEPGAVIEQAGSEPQALLGWVARETSWIPYRGALKGARGTLADRAGNSLDRSLLLATLLEAAGFQVRLAHAELSEEAGRALLAKWKPPAPAALSGDAIPSSKDATSRAAAQAVALEAVVRDLARPSGDGAAERLACARDHWWVEHHVGGEWRPLDPSSPDGPLGAAAATTCGLPGPGAWPKELPAHEVEILVVIEAWMEGELVERPVVSATLRPCELLGKTVSLDHHPMNGKSLADEKGDAAIRKTALETREWMPVIRAGARHFAKASFDDEGNVRANPDLSPAARLGGAAGGLFGALGGAATGDGGAGGEKKSLLTAEWVLLTFSAPGRPERVVRREIFDLLGPAARATKAPARPELDEARRLDRALRLAGWAEWTLLPAHAPWSLALQTTIQHELDQRRLVLSVLREPDPVRRRALAAGLSDTGPLLWVAAARRSMNPARGESWIDATNAIGLHFHLAASPGGKLVERAVLDLASCPVTGAADSTRFAAVLRQGVADAVAEDLAFGGQGDALDSALDFIETARGQGLSLVALRGAQDPAIAAMGLPADTSARIRADLAAGHLVVLPEKPLKVGAELRTAWWRVDPASGETVAVLDTGYHSDTAEYVEENTVISRTVIRRRPTREFWGQRASDIARQAGFDPARNPGIVQDIMELQRHLRVMDLLI